MLINRINIQLNRSVSVCFSTSLVPPQVAQWVEQPSRHQNPTAVQQNNNIPKGVNKVCYYVVIDHSASYSAVHIKDATIAEIWLLVPIPLKFSDDTNFNNIAKI